MDNMLIRAQDLESLCRERSPGWASLLDRALLAKPSDLDAAELRYLRRRAGWTEGDVARVLGISSNVTVARWESGARRIPRPTERLFRLLLANALGTCSSRYLAEQFKLSWRQANSPLEIYLYPDRDRFEYRWASSPKSLPKRMRHLFWDTDPRRLHLQRQAPYIIVRVVEKGDLDDWNWLRWTYGAERITSTLKQRPKLSPAVVCLWQEDRLAHPGVA